MFIASPWTLNSDGFIEVDSQTFTETIYGMDV